MMRSTSGTLGLRGSRVGFPVSCHGLEAETAAWLRGIRLQFARRTLTVSCACGICKWQEGRHMLRPCPLLSALGPPCCGLS